VAISVKPTFLSDELKQFLLLKTLDAFINNATVLNDSDSATIKPAALCEFVALSE